MAIFSTPKSKKEYSEDQAQELRVRAQRVEQQRAQTPQQREANLREAQRLRELADREDQRADAYEDEYGV